MKPLVYLPFRPSRIDPTHPPKYAWATPGPHRDTQSIDSAKSFSEVITRTDVYTDQE